MNYFFVLLCRYEEDCAKNVHYEEDCVANSLGTIITNLVGFDGRIKDYSTQVRALTMNLQ